MPSVAKATILVTGQSLVTSPKGDSLTGPHNPNSNVVVDLRNKETLNNFSCRPTHSKAVQKFGLVIFCPRGRLGEDSPRGRHPGHVPYRAAAGDSDYPKTVSARCIHVVKTRDVSRFCDVYGALAW